MAEVKMSLEELRELENKIETLEVEKKELLDNQMKVIVNHKYFKGRLRGIDKGNRTIVHMQIRDESYNSRFDGGYNMPSVSYSDKTLSLSGAYKQGLIDISFDEQADEVTTKDFINLEEVTDQIRKEQMSRIDTQLQEANSRASKSEYELSQAADKNKKKILGMTDRATEISEIHDKKINDLKKQHSGNIEAMKDVYDNEKAELEKQIDALSNAKVKKTLEQELRDAKSEIKRITNLTFWQRVFA